MARLDFFALGSNYYPPFHPPEDWERDVSRMAEAGLNAMRTADLLAGWEWIEAKEGVFDFDWLDRLFELAEKYGLGILLSTGAAQPPIWLLDKYPDVQIVSQDKVPYPTGANFGWACVDHPGYLAESERYLRVLLKRYKDHPALVGWQIHNEIGYPSPPRESGVTEIYCYCEHTAARFRDWLRAKYEGDIEALSEAWATTPARIRYHDWQQVQPPRVRPVGWGSPRSWLDWRTFINQHFADFVAWQNEIIKAGDPVHPTTHNLALGTNLGVERGVDPWLYPETGLDAFGYDIYPVGRFKEEPWWTSFRLDYYRAPALHAGMPCWVPEIESGPIGGWVLGPWHATTARDIRRYDLEAIAHGVKMILYHGYRDWDPFPLRWGGLVDLHGEPTERYEAARQVNSVVQAHETLFLEAEPVRAEVAIICDQANLIALYGMGASEFLLQAIKGVYYALWSQGYPVEFITPELLAAGAGDRYKVIFMPFLMLVAAEGGAALADFAAKGGTVVAFANCAMLDGRSWYWHDRPGAGLAAVFGVRERFIQQAEEVALVPEPGAALFDGVTGPLAGHWHRQDLQLAEGTEVLARFADGEPAVTCHSYGDGQAYAFGTHFDVATLLHRDDEHRRVFANLLREAGVERAFIMEGGAQLDGHLLMRGEQMLFILANHGTKDATATVRLPRVSADVAVTDLFAERLLETSHDGTGLRFGLSVPGYDGTAVLIE